MKTSLTNELIREVYPIDMDKDCYVDIHKETGKVMWFGKELNDCRSEIDKHNVANKCKDWALKQGYYFSIYSFNFSNNTEQEHRIRLLIGNEIVYYGNDSCEETEPDAIFKACEWIRKKLKG